MIRGQQQTPARAGTVGPFARAERRFGSYRPGFDAGVLLPALIVFGVPTAALVYYKFGILYAFFLLLSVVCLYIFFRPRDGLWLAVPLVALINSLFQYSPEEISAQREALGVPGAGYIIAASVIGVGLAMLVGYVFMRRQKKLQARVTSPHLLAATLGMGVICLISVGYGLHRGNNPHFVLRHASGPCLLFLFILAGALVLSSRADWARAVRNAEVVAAGYVVVYVARYGTSSLKHGQFKYGEDLVLFYASMFASVCFATLLFSKDPKEKRQGRLLLPLLVIGSVMSGSRGDVAATLFACAVLLLLKIINSPGKFAALVMSIGLLLVLNPVRIARDVLQGSSIGDSFAQRFLISPANDASYNLRVSEMQAVKEEVSRKPLLGDGLGSTYSYYDPYEHHYIEGTFVDSGFGYMLLRFGYLGTTVAMAWILTLLVFLLKRCRTVPTGENASLVAMFSFYVASLIFTPSFFDFPFAWWGGALCGYILCLPKVSRPAPGAKLRRHPAALPALSRFGRASQDSVRMLRQVDLRGS
jgi:hypothetical protein